MTEKSNRQTLSFLDLADYYKIDISQVADMTDPEFDVWIKQAQVKIQEHEQEMLGKVDIPSRLTVEDVEDLKKGFPSWLPKVDIPHCVGLAWLHSLRKPPRK